MRTGLIIADFEMSFTTSFRHTAAKKYRIDFTNSHINHIKDQLRQLKQNIMTKDYDERSRLGNGLGYDFGLEEVEHIENLLTELLNRYRQAFPTTAHPNPKIYKVIEQLRGAEMPDVKQIAKEALTEVFAPSDRPEKQTPQQRFDTAVAAKSMERHLKTIRTNTSKKQK